MSVEFDARVLTVVQIYQSSDFTTPARSKELAVRGGSGAAAPMSRQGLAILRIDQGGKGQRIALFANVPSDVQQSCRQVVSRQASTMRASPRLMASANI